jgi:hypothetical protein
MWFPGGNYRIFLVLDTDIRKKSNSFTLRSHEFAPGLEDVQMM